MHVISRIAIATLLAIAPVSHAVAAPAAEPTYDCADAKALPADVNPMSRRITCTIPMKYRQDVLMAELVGRAIRLHDMAAWLTTDALQEKQAFANLPASWVGKGWVTREHDGGVDVHYVSNVDGHDAAIAGGTLQLEPFKVVDAAALSPPKPLDEREQRLLRARELALGQNFGLCTKAYPNVASFEFDEDGRKQILVFVMSAWVDEAPLGGYYMVRVSEDGSRVLDTFAQTRGCLTTPNDKLNGIEALSVTHLTSATPTMFHVFMSLQYRKPIYVGTAENGLMWKVDNGNISLVAPSGSPAAAGPTVSSPASTSVQTP